MATKQTGAFMLSSLPFGVHDQVVDLASQAHRAGLIDLDVTVFIQGGLFLALVVLLPRIIFRPMLERIEQREARTDGARAEAKAMRHAADEQVTAYDQATAEEKRRALEERAQVRTATQHKAQDMIAQARTQTAARIDAGLAAQREQATAARKQLAGEAEIIGALIADKLAEG